MILAWACLEWSYMYFGLPIPSYTNYMCMILINLGVTTIIDILPGIIDIIYIYAWNQQFLKQKNCIGNLA